MNKGFDLGDAFSKSLSIFLKLLIYKYLILVMEENTEIEVTLSTLRKYFSQ